MSDKMNEEKKEPVSSENTEEVKPEPKTGTRRQSRKYIYWRMSIIPMSIFP